MVNQDEDLVGRRYGKRVVIARCGSLSRKGNRGRLWLLLCECGRKSRVPTGALKHSNSCRFCCNMKNGILQDMGKKAHTSWASARSRCRNPNDKNYANYGGRGIKVAEEWNEFLAFYHDMGDPPSHKHTLDRIDVHGHYEPGNCRWATPQEQADNRRKYMTLDKFTNEEIAAEFYRRKLNTVAAT